MEATHPCRRMSTHFPVPDVRGGLLSLEESDWSLSLRHGNEPSREIKAKAKATLSLRPTFHIHECFYDCSLFKVGDEIEYDSTGFFNTTTGKDLRKERILCPLAAPVPA